MTIKTPLFSTGTVAATPGVFAATSMEHLAACIVRHVTGDWGLVCDDDKRANDESVMNGTRIISSYPLSPTRPDEKLWIITEADREYTTFMLPEEY